MQWPTTDTSLTHIQPICTDISIRFADYDNVKVFMMSDVYVSVVHDFNYHTDDGIEVKMKAGEELLLLKKANKNWWQVIRGSDNCPFYAPSNYLSIIKLNCKDSVDRLDVNSNFFNQKKRVADLENNITEHVSETVNNGNNGHNSFKDVSIKKAKNALLFKNPLWETEILKSQHQNPLQKRHIPSPCDVKYDSDSAPSCDTSFTEDSQCPIYMNVPVSFTRCPPTPKVDEKPIRKLSDNWFEYIDVESGRKYYSHSPTGKVTWKPPRRKESYQSESINDSPDTQNSKDSLSVPEPPPKQLKPKLNKLSHSSNESLESQSDPVMFTILPPGWSQETDSTSGTIYYHHKGIKKKWYASADENGRTYFYDEDNSESLWELPDAANDPGNLEENKQSPPIEKKELSTAAVNEVVSVENSFGRLSISPKLQKRTDKPVPRHYKARSLIVPECVNLSGSEDSKGYLPPSFGEGYWPSVQDGHFFITRKGTLNKTKVVEGGRRIRKNWTSSFVVLTDVFLLFYKDIRSAHLALPGIKPELCIDLNGALVEWCPGQSSRKNVFKISTVLGHQLLLQDDNAHTTREWFETIQAAIMMLPSSVDHIDAKHSTSYREDVNKREVKLSRSKSTKHYSPGKASDVEYDVTFPAEKKRKIRDKLRQFFVRRPTQESLREKGILLDEPVFGCHLENLCTRENRKIPKFVTTCIEVIEEKELTADGLYRASGNLSQVQKIRMHVNQDDYSCLKDEDDVHVLTGALKLFFREMKEPLFPFNLFDKFLHAIAQPDANSKLEALKKLVAKLPEPNYETLKILLQHLLRVTEYHKQNRMQVQNLAIVFGPTLLWPEHTSANIALDMMHQNRIIEFLLLEYKVIFDI